MKKLAALDCTIALALALFSLIGCNVTDSTDDPANKKTLKQLDAAGAETYRTSTCGSIVVRSDGQGTYSVSTDDYR